MSLPIYQRVAVTDAGDVIPGAEYTVINENTGVAAPIYSDRTGATLLTAPYFADSAGTIQFFIAQGTTFRVAASGGVGTYTDRYVYGVAEAVLVQADGNVGIGTSSPGNILKILNSANGDGINVENSNASFSESGLFVNNTASTGGNLLKLRSSGSDKVVVLGNGNVGIGTSSLDGNWAPKLQISSSTTNGTGGVLIESYRPSLIFKDLSATAVRQHIVADSSSLLFGSGDASFTERMRIDSSGNCGIGTSSPMFKLDVAGNARASYFAIRTNEAIPAESAFMYRPSTGALGFGTSGFERMRINSAGDVSIGTSANAGYKLVAEGSGTVVMINRTGSDGAAILFNNDGAVAGTISVSGTSTAYNTSSDYRLKKDDVAMTGATERVKALRPINFAWKVDGSRVDGFFAHELAEVVPEAATGTKDAMMDQEYEVTPAVYEDVITPAVEAVLDEDGVVITEAVEESTESVLVTEAVMATRSVPDYQGIDQSKLVPLLTATIQELIARIEALEAGA